MYVYIEISTNISYTVCDIIINLKRSIQMAVFIKCRTARKFPYKRTMKETKINCRVCFKQTDYYESDHHQILCHKNDR